MRRIASWIGKGSPIWKRFTLLAVSCLPIAAPSQQPLPTDRNIEAAKERFRLPSDKTLQRQGIPTLPNVPDIQQGIDVGALAKRFELRMHGAQDTSASTTGLFVFVTLEMPEPSMRKLIDQAARSGATLMLRGVRNHSLRQTLSVVHRLIGHTQVAWLIDPQAFQRFGVTAAPTFVLARDDLPTANRIACENGCLDPSAYARVAGDVTLEHALEHIEKHEPAFAPLAARYLSRLRRSP